MATCNDCPTPIDFSEKYITKAEKSYWHSKGFSLQDYHEPIMIRPQQFHRRRGLAIWVYIVTLVGNLNAVTATKATLASVGDDWNVMSMTRGPFTEGTIEALNAAEKLPRVAKTIYELRFLKAPAVYFAVVV